MKEIKFRAWDVEDKRFLDPIDCTQLVIRPLSGRVTDGATTPNVELMQYTGLKDKNGVEIYEGDIVKYATMFEAGRTATVVIFRDGAFWLGYSLLFRCKNITVIGNRYENPELLKEEPTC